MLRSLAQYKHYIVENTDFHYSVGTVMKGDSVTASIIMIDSLMKLIG